MNTSRQFSTLGGTGSFTIQYADTGTLMVTASAILPSNLGGGGSGGSGPSPDPGAPPPPPPDRPILVAAGQIGIATQANAEVPEPALALPVALVLGVFLFRRKG